ncbi:MAG: glutathione S-transferase family protein [Rhizobiaceae bacterium]|nr:glutathione S-transferase family protein [Rhizobiaceae bacterium]
MPFELTLASAFMGPGGHISKGGEPFGIVNTPEYRAMNPNGTLPTIKDGDYVLWESNAILAYIALKYAPDLYGNDVETFGRAIGWGSWANEHLDPITTYLVLHITRLASHLRDPALAEKGKAEMPKQVKTLDDQLAKQSYLAGDSFTIADISVGPAIHRWVLFDPDRPRFPHVEEWYARLCERAPFQKHIIPEQNHFDPD